MVRTLKEKFGFITSVDVEREDIFFHYSEVANQSSPDFQNK